MAAALALAALLMASLWTLPAIAAARTVQITADTVIATDQGQVVEARGHVVVTDGRIRISADRMNYNRKTGRIQLTGSVNITTPQGTLRSAEATAQLTRGRVLDVITAAGDVTVQSADRVLKADRLTYQAKDDTLTARGHVVVTFPPDLTVTGGELFAKGVETATITGRARIQNRDGSIEGDRLEVNGLAQTALARGNVVAIFQETRITSASATLLAKENRAVFREKVIVTRPDRVMMAQTVTYFYKEKRIVAEGQTTIKFQETPP